MKEKTFAKAILASEPPRRNYMKSLPYGPSGRTTDDVRTLRRIAPLATWQASVETGPPHMKIAVLDLETTGFDPQYDEILELAVAMISIDVEGRVLGVEGLRTGLQQPTRPIEPHITKITGIGDAIVAGKVMYPQNIAAYLEQADACLAFNAQFDRRHLEQFVPEAGSMPWICGMADVPWADLGFDGRGQGYLLMQCGMFNPVAHRAADDVASLVNLLAHQLADGRTVLSHALENAQAPSWRFEATGLPYHLRKDIYRRGYRYSFHRVNHKLVRSAEYQKEVDSYCDLVGREPTVVPVDWVERYRADWTWEPIKPVVKAESWRRRR